MPQSRFLEILLVSTLIFLSFIQGFGRVLMETVEHQHSQENPKKWRVMIEVMDYGDTTPKNGYIFSPSSPPPRP